MDGAILYRHTTSGTDVGAMAHYFILLLLFNKTAFTTGWVCVITITFYKQQWQQE
jgi:hypothetical protein